MGKRCAVAGCSNSFKTGHSVHLFPKLEQQRVLWIRFVKLTRIDFSEPTQNSAICSAHFSDDCYEVDRIKFKELFGMSTNKRLLPNSVPSIYPKRPADVLNEHKKKLRTSVALQKRETEMPKKGKKAYSRRVKENKDRMREIRKKRQEKEEQETLKITNSSTGPESGAPMKKRKETEKYNMTTSEVTPEKKMKLEQKLVRGNNMNKQDKVVNKNMESADEISTPSAVNVTVTRRMLHSDIGTDVSMEKDRSLLATSAKLTDKTKNMRSLLPMNISTDKKTQNLRSLLTFQISTDKKTQNSRSLLPFNIITDKKTQNARSLLPFNIITDKKTQNARSLLPPNTSTDNKADNVNCLSPLKADHSKSLSSFKAGPVTESQSARSLLSLNAGPVTESQSARSLLSLNASTVTESQSARSLLSLNAGPVSESQSSTSLLSLNAGQVTDSQISRSLLSLNASPVTESQSAKSLLSLDTSPITKNQNARSLLPLNIRTACDTKNARSLLHNVQLPLNAGTVIKTQNQKIFQSSLLEKNTQKGHSQNSISSIKDCQNKGSTEGPSQTVQNVLDTGNVQEKFFSVCINRTKGSPNVKIIQPEIGKEVNKKNRLENLLKHSKLCTHRLQTQAKKENLQSTTQKRSVTKPFKERKSMGYQRRGCRLRENILFRSREITDYQVQDLSWLLSLFTHGINGVLNEEMGLSKTVQAIVLLGYMKDYQQISGPHLFIVPLSNIDHWLAEFKRWSPESRLVVIKGTVEQRGPAKDILKDDGWDVCITSYQTCFQEPNAFKEINWRYLIVDEVQTIIKEKSQISEIIQSMKTSNKLLLTGIQPQNDLQELLALQNILFPESTNDIILRSPNQLCDKELVNCLHNILHLFLLKRIKEDLEKGLLPTKEIYTYVGLYTLQRDWQTRRAEDPKEKLDNNMNSEKKMEINRQVSSPCQSKLEIIQPCKIINTSVGLKSLLKDNTSIANRTQSRKTLQSILQANKSTQGSSQNNSNMTYSLNDLQKKGSEQGSSQNVQITSDSRNSPERAFSVCVESSKGSPYIKIIQSGVEEKVGENKVNFDLQSHPDEICSGHKLRRNKKRITELNAKLVDESNESEDGKVEKSSDDEIFLKDKLSGNEIQEKYLSFVKHYINGEFEYKGTRKLNCIPAVSDHQSVCPCIVCGDQAVGMYFGIMVCYSCRTFIVATVQYRSILKCEAQSNCTIYFCKEFCPHCRFKKCLWAGAVVAEVPLRLQKLSQFKQSLTVKRKKLPKRTSKPIKVKTCVKPATATRRAPTMYLTSDTDCDNKDDCDKLVDSSYPIKLSGGQKNHRSEKLTSISHIKSESSKVTLCSGIKETEIPLKPLSENNNMEENFHYFKQNSGPISTSDILTDWQRLHKSVQEQFQKLKN
ncbi:SMARCA5 [Mytilus coruscus]|uniref:SMARCA5 n=1 Tax=Mytilus coruscus TaxID=42192 RepID=A0A6J8F059_MYTCO|nr:SMARCA5 [Mytilus coruscus]